MGYDASKRYLTRGVAVLDRPSRAPAPYYRPPRRYLHRRPPQRRTMLIILAAGLTLTAISLIMQNAPAQVYDVFLSYQRALQPGRDPTTWPFNAQSPWNMPIASTATFAAPGTPCTQALTDPAIPAAMNTLTWSHAVFRAHEVDPQFQVAIGYDPATNGKATITIHIPPNAAPSPPAASVGGDARMYVIDPAGRFVDEFWKMQPTRDGNWSAAVHVRTDLYGSGVGAWGVRAYGGSGLGGLLRVGELTNGIHHAIAFSVPAGKQNGQFVWPAIARDFGYPASVYQGPISMGQFAAIPPNVNLAKLGLSPQGLRLAQALQNYGGYVVDSSTNYSYYGDPPVYAELGNLARDLTRIHDQLRCVTNNTQGTVGGGTVDAPRRAELASPLQGAPWVGTRPSAPPIALMPDRRRQPGQMH